MKNLIGILIIIVISTVLYGCNSFDKESPVISFINGNDIEVEVNSEFEIADNIKVADNKTKNPTISQVGEVDTDKKGVYELQCIVTDEAGNSATENLVVSIVDTQAPVIQLNDKQSLEVNYNSEYVEPGATAIDNYDELCDIVSTGDVNTSELGMYTIEFTAIDSSGNQVTTKRTVKVCDLTPPVIELKGLEKVELNIGEQYNEQGASALDAIDGELDVKISNNINYLKEGNYEIIYTATDKAGNIAEAKREVTIKPIEIKTSSGITTILKAIETNFESDKPDSVLAFDLTIINNSTSTIEVPPMFLFENSNFDEHEFNCKIINYFSIDKLEKGQSISEKLEFSYDGNQEDLINSKKIKFNYSTDGQYYEFPYVLDIRIADFID